ncbi:hypothetical protein E4M02_00390 [Brevundimonas sp. S30B]|uniref:hypothetical protein n=1 Tax=unclassified Brevundimonas TaxID=2622653 RepID=UPI0010721D6C|nr:MULTISPECIES: hypothetical protein [unclassified Brevundimonas]QBX37617.1 hypothetical protein E4M01_07430 [Brevundimonas sp. MF30-B]TFW03590.1 hypothetical protein E4M02_00390 [Brevundimonas sp. S30B]
MRLMLASMSAVVALSAGPVAAQRYWGPEQIPDCARDVSVENCRAQSLALLLHKLQLPDAAEIAKDGYRGVRVFQYDDFGVTWPAVAFLTRPINEYRREGVALTRAIQADGHVAALERSAWEIGWREVDGVIAAIKASPPSEERPTWNPTRLTSPLAPPPPPTCLHPPTIIIEIIDEGQVQRWWPYTCRADAAVAEASRIASLIAAAFPVCGHLDIARYGSGLGRVRACLMVGGKNPYAAVEVMDILRPGIRGDTRAAYEEDRQSDHVSLLGFDGRRAAGRDAVIEALNEGALGPRWLRVLRATGDGEGVTVIGRLDQVAEINNPDPIAVAIRWAEDSDGESRIVDWSVEQH